VAARPRSAQRAAVRRRWRVAGFEQVLREIEQFNLEHKVFVRLDPEPAEHSRKALCLRCQLLRKKKDSTTAAARQRTAQEIPVQHMPDLKGWSTSLSRQ